MQRLSILPIRAGPRPPLHRNLHFDITSGTVAPLHSSTCQVFISTRTYSIPQCRNVHFPSSQSRSAGLFPVPSITLHVDFILVNRASSRKMAPWVAVGNNVPVTLLVNTSQDTSQGKWSDIYATRFMGSRRPVIGVQGILCDLLSFVEKGASQLISHLPSNPPNRIPATCAGDWDNRER